MGVKVNLGGGELHQEGFVFLALLDNILLLAIPLFLLSMPPQYFCVGLMQYSTI